MDEDTDENIEIDEGTYENIGINEGTDENIEIDEGTDENIEIDEGTDENIEIDEGTDENIEIDEGTDENIEIDEGTYEDVSQNLDGFIYLDKGTGESISVPDKDTSPNSSPLYKNNDCLFDFLDLFTKSEIMEIFEKSQKNNKPEIGLIMLDYITSRTDVNFNIDKSIGKYLLEISNKSNQIKYLFGKFDFSNKCRATKIIRYISKDFYSDVNYDITHLDNHIEQEYIYYILKTIIEKNNNCPIF